MIPRLCAALLCAALLPQAAGARPADAMDPPKSPAWVDPGWRRTLDRFTVRFDEQGRSVTTFEFEFSALDDKGAAAVAQESFSYNSYFSDLAGADLATVKADGRVIPVDPRAIRDQPAEADGGSPYFDERRVKIIAYPDVAAGDRIRGRMTWTDRKPEFPGAFAGYWSQYANEPPGIMELTLDGPASMPLHVTARGVRHSEERIGDRIVHRVVFRQETPRRLVDEVDGFDGARRFEASTFPDYAAFAATLAARNGPMAAPDDSIRALSGEIVGDAATLRVKVERIHDWVARHIRYVGIGFEDGGWTAQPAADTLATRYGDCKAHVTLEKALLAAQGIAADMVAVNSNARYTLTERATANFNHAIVYVPALDLYLDPTAPVVAFGALPSQLYGKPGLDVDRGRLVAIPPLKPEQFVIETQTDTLLRPDGTRQAKSVYAGSGLGGSQTRRVALWAETVDDGAIARNALKAADLTGAGVSRFANPRELAERFSIGTTLEITQPAPLDEPTRLPIRAFSPHAATLWDMIAGRDPEGAFLCRSLDYRDADSLALPAGLAVFEKPAALDFDKSFRADTLYGPVTGRIVMHGEVAIDGAIARATSRLTASFSGPVCPAGFAAEIRAAIGKFDAFRRAVVGVTPHAVARVAESGSDTDLGLSAYRARNYPFALMKFLAAAQRGDADARDHVGEMFEKGQGVAQDYGAARAWYELAAAQGDALGQSHLGYLAANGLGAPPDRDLAREWYLKAARQGDAYSQFALGGIYQRGEGVAQDYGAALGWYEKAAAQGHLEAQTMVGFFHERGYGVPSDDAEAARWFRDAAERGDRFAQVHLGTLYAHGRGVARDCGRAVDLFRKAAAQGDAEGRYDLGLAYETGCGVAADPHQAADWYRLAAGQGNVDARARLDALNGAGRSWFWTGVTRALSLSSR